MWENVLLAAAISGYPAPVFDVGVDNRSTCRKPTGAQGDHADSISLEKRPLLDQELNSRPFCWEATVLNTALPIGGSVKQDLCSWFVGSWKMGKIVEIFLFNNALFHRKMWTKWLKITCSAFCSANPFPISKHVVKKFKWMQQLLLFRVCDQQWHPAGTDSSASDLTLKDLNQTQFSSCLVDLKCVLWGKVGKACLLWVAVKSVMERLCPMEF